MAGSSDNSVLMIPVSKKMYKELQEMLAREKTYRTYNFIDSALSYADTRNFDTYVKALFSMGFKKRREWLEINGILERDKTDVMSMTRKGRRRNLAYRMKKDEEAKKSIEDWDYEVEKKVRRIKKLLGGLSEAGRVDL